MGGGGPEFRGQQSPGEKGRVAAARGGLHRVLRGWSECPRQGGLDPYPLPRGWGGGTASALALFPSLKGGGSLQHGGGR